VLQGGGYAEAVTTRTPDPQLMVAARAAFAKYGYQDSTVERIAAEAGLSRVTLHRRGVSKELLLGWLVEEGTAAYRAALWPALTGGEDARTRLEEALRALCGVAEEHAAVLNALRSASDEVFHDDGEEALTRTEFTEPLERLLRDGMADGSLRVTDPAETATVLFNLVGSSYLHLRGGHHWPSERTTEAVLDVALNGVTP